MGTILYILFVIFAICFILLAVSIFFLLEKLALRSIIGLYVTGILIIVVATISHFLPDSKQTNVEDNMVNAIGFVIAIVCVVYGLAFLFLAVYMQKNNEMKKEKDMLQRKKNHQNSMELVHLIKKLEKF